MSHRAKASKDSVSEVRDFGVAEDRTEKLGGYTVNFVSIRQDQDLAPILSRLPGGHCTCPHRGYVLKGEMTVRYSDHEEIVQAGEAFSMPPGHVLPPRPVPSSFSSVRLIRSRRSRRTLRSDCRNCSTCRAPDRR